MGRVGSAVAIAAAAVITVLMAAVAYGLTSEYGPAPNGGGVGEALLGIAGGAPGALLVGVLLAVGARGASRGSRLRLAVGGAVAALLAIGLGVLLGDRALQQRCEERGVQHSAACPR